MRVKKDLDRSRLIAAAMGELACDLTVKNLQFVNVMTGQIYPAEVDVLDGVVVQVRPQGCPAPLPARSEYDAGGRYLAPGCIDVHMHVESTMLTPENFGRAAILCGTTSVFVDPHEIANVLGIDGVKFMVENAKTSPVRQFNLAPSCLPSVPGAEGNGAEFGPEEIARLLETEGVYGIAEVMDFYNVIHDSPKMHRIIEEGLARGLLIQGHAPKLPVGQIDAYRLAGPTDNHSLRVGWEVVANLNAGLYVDLQESSLGARTMPQLLEGLKGMRYTDHVCLCNDDVHAKDLVETGHVNRLIKSVLREGVHPVDALRWATYNSAQSARMEDIGALAPGYLADMQLLDELDGRNPYAVFVGGRLVAEGGRLLEETPARPIPAGVLGATVRPVGLTGPEALCLPAPEGAKGSVRVAVLDYAAPTARSDLFYEELPVKGGRVDLSGRADLCYISVWNRHGANSHTVAIAKNLGLRRGAMATTVSHDCHNLTLCYTDPADGYIAAKALVDCGGGFAVAQGGALLQLLELPVAGLMSCLPCEELVAAIARQEAATEKVFGAPGFMMRLSLVSLACTQNAVITDRGLFDGRTQKFYRQFLPDEEKTGACG